MHPSYITFYSILKGACPKLARLKLADRDCSGASEHEPAVSPIVVDALAIALGSGHLHHLQELSLDGHLSSYFAKIAAAMTAIGRPFSSLTDFKAFGSPSIPASSQSFDSLIDLIASGICPHLEELPIWIDGIGDSHLTALTAALSDGQYPHLMQLDLEIDQCTTVPERAVAVGQLLVSGALPKLEVFTFSTRCWGHRPVEVMGELLMCLLQAVRDSGNSGGRMPSLKALGLFNCDKGVNHACLLAEVLAMEVMPVIEESEIFQDGLDDERVLPPSFVDCGEGATG